MTLSITLCNTHAVCNQATNHLLNQNRGVRCPVYRLSSHQVAGGTASSQTGSEHVGRMAHGSPRERSIKPQESGSASSYRTWKAVRCCASRLRHSWSSHRSSHLASLPHCMTRCHASFMPALCSKFVVGCGDVRFMYDGCC